MMRSRFAVALASTAMLFVVIGLSAELLSRGRRDENVAPAVPFYSGIGTYSRTITTRSPTAQRYFDQGLAFLFAFNHDEALRSFEAAAANDASCAMAYWGIAAASGPDINYTQVDPAAAQKGCAAVSTARDISLHATPVERDLVEAIAKHFADAAPATQMARTETYVSAMKNLWKAYPKDPDIGALNAEALLILHNSRQRTLGGDATFNAAELFETLDKVLAISPRHPLALHLTIHAREGTAHPEKAAAAADLMRHLAPGIGHLLHMPSHIDVRLGHWRQAVVANERAIVADHAYRRMEPRIGTHLSYMSHSHHMLAYAAMMQGSSKQAAAALEEMLSRIPERYIRSYPDKCDGYFGLTYELHLRFGQWDAMLAERQPQESLPLTTALWHYGRGISFAVKHQLKEANTEKEAFAVAKCAVSQNLRFLDVRAGDLLRIAEQMLAGEIHYREGKIDQGVTALRAAVKLEDNLEYGEPPVWMLPVRHVLGATLMDAGRYADAESVYREDLVRRPENGWSLFGLASSLRKQGKSAQAEQFATRFRKAWQFADVALTSSCFCLRGTDMGSDLVKPPLNEGAPPSRSEQSERTN